MNIKKNSNGCYFALISDRLGTYCLIRASAGLFIADFYKSSFYPLKFFNKSSLGSTTYIGLLVENIFLFSVSIQTAPIFARAAGVFCQILNILDELSLVLIQLPSKKKMYLSSSALCNIGRSSNVFKKYNVLGSASYHILYGRKPVVRGVAKNPVDHPHGGRTKTNKPEVSPWG